MSTTTDDRRRPLLLIDVDGVLNPFVRGAEVPEDFVERRIDGMRVLLSPRHGEQLLSLRASFELAWASTWEADANQQIGAVLGLPPLPHVAFTPVADWDQAWTRKVPDVEAFATGRPLAWLDDRFDADDFRWAERRSAGGLPTLLMQTEAHVGLTQEHITILNAFADELKG